MGTWCVDGGIFLTPLMGLQVGYARDDDAQSMVVGDWCLAGRLDVSSLEAWVQERDGFWGARGRVGSRETRVHWGWLVMVARVSGGESDVKLGERKYSTCCHA